MSDELKKAMRRARVANARVAELLKAQEKRAKAGGDDAVKVMGAAVAPLAVKDLDVLGV